MIIFTVIGVIVMAYIIMATGGLLLICAFQSKKNEEVHLDIESADVPDWYTAFIVVMLFPVFVKKYLKIRKMKTE